MSKEAEVVVTGMGVVSPLGVGAQTFWDHLRQGKSGIDWISSFDAEDFDVRYAGQVHDFEPTRHLKRTPPNPRDRTLQLSLVASREALRQAAVIDDDDLAICDLSVATIIGTGHGPCFEVEHGYQRYHEGGARAVSPTTLPRCMYNSLSSNLSIYFGLRGANHVISSACASASCAIGQAYWLIRHGGEQIVLSGGADSPLCKTVYVTWARMRVLAKHANPSQACRPFDADRTGLVLGEGAGMVVLESRASAEARGANILARVEGYGSSSDAHHITEPRQEGARLAIERCLDNAGMKASEIDYINAHGTGTTLNDELEARVIASVFGCRGERLPVSSIKSMIGHALGASGALEFICCVDAMRHNFVPPTLNCDSPSPDLGLDFVPRAGRKHAVRAAMSNSFAFGGNNAVLILRSA